MVVDYLSLRTSGGILVRLIRSTSQPETGVEMTEVFIVDSETILFARPCRLSWTTQEFQATGFADAKSFLEVVRWRAPQCALIDVHLPGCSGLELLKMLNARRYRAPIFVISGRSDIPTAVEAIRNGALDFIEKPFRPATVVVRIRDAVQAWQNLGRGREHVRHDFHGRERLTARERDVLERIARGASNKETGGDLGISSRTVEVHRARIIEEKLGARNAADLMQIVLGRYRSLWVRAG